MEENKQVVYQCEANVAIALVADGNDKPDFFANCIKGKNYSFDIKYKNYIDKYKEFFSQNKDTNARVEGYEKKMAGNSLIDTPKTEKSVNEETAKKTPIKTKPMTTSK